MKLESLNISCHAWDDNKLYGNIKFSGSSGDIQLILKQEQCQEILQIVAKELVASAKEVARDLTEELVESTGILLEHKAAE